MKQRNLEENKKHVNDQVEKQTKESYEEKGKLETRKDGLEEEIRRIREELRMREAELVSPLIIITSSY